MTTENNDIGNNNVDPITAGDLTDDPTVLKAEVETLRAEVAKQRSQKNKLAQETAELKRLVNTKPVSDASGATENYKQLALDAQNERDSLLITVKKSAINAALTTRLNKLGVIPDAHDAAVKLVDHSTVEWDMDSGVDIASVDAAVANLRKDFSFMFEKKVSGTDPKQAADRDRNVGSKVINRQDFDRLTPTDKIERMKAGYTIR